MNSSEDCKCTVICFPYFNGASLKPDNKTTQLYSYFLLGGFKDIFTSTSLGQIGPSACIIGLFRCGPVVKITMPRPWMYGICTYILVMFYGRFMIMLFKYIIHWVYGIVGCVFTPLHKTACFVTMSKKIFLEKRDSVIRARSHATASSPDPVRVGFVNPLMSKVCGNEPILRKFMDNKSFTLVCSKSGILPQNWLLSQHYCFIWGGNTWSRYDNIYWKILKDAGSQCLFFCWLLPPGSLT